MAHTIWGGSCYSNNSWRAYSTYCTLCLASTNCDFQSSMLNFRPIRWSYNPLFFSWSYLTQSLVNFYTSCLRFATVSTLVIPSSYIYKIKNILALSKLAPFYNFTFEFFMPKSSCEWCELSLKSHFSNLWLVYYAQMLSFLFWCHINNNSPIGRMSIVLCYPTFNKPSHQFIVCYLHNPIQIFQYNLFFCI